ncbi:hypothetical protein HDV63DRAFT_277409 [Trichoderma sp. SZMC 28014]
MPTSSTGATYGGGVVANELRTATDNATQATTRPCVPVPSDLKHSISCFLDKSKETAAGGQRPLPGFGKTKSDTEAVAEAEARMRKELRAFDARFSGGSSAGK